MSLREELAKARAEPAIDLITRKVGYWLSTFVDELQAQKLDSYVQSVKDHGENRKLVQSSKEFKDPPYLTFQAYAEALQQLEATRGFEKLREFCGNPARDIAFDLQLFMVEEPFVGRYVDYNFMLVPENKFADSRVSGWYNAQCIFDRPAAGTASSPLLTAPPVKVSPGRPSRKWWKIM